MRRSAGPVPTLPRTVLDTNVFLSALLFEGTTSRLVPLWQTGRLVFLLSKSILEEYLRALAYPKFQLTDREIRSLVEEELLPFATVVADRIPKTTPYLRDTSDRKFLACALVGEADYLLTGDRELLAQRKVGKTLIIPPGRFEAHLPPPSGA